MFLCRQDGTRIRGLSVYTTVMKGIVRQLPVKVNVES
jgi:hypothetical protein